MEKRISDMLSGIDAGEVDIAISNTVSADRIKEITMNKIHANKKPHRPVGKMTRMVLIAAVLALVLGIGVGAYMGVTQYANPDELFDAFFGEDKYSSRESYTEERTGFTYNEDHLVDGTYTWEQYFPSWNALPISDEMRETLSPHVYALDESVTYGDYTLTVHACLYSANTGCGMVYYTLENPHGVGNYEITPKGQVKWLDYNEVYLLPFYGFERVDSANTTDTKLSACLFFVSCGARSTNIPYEERDHDLRPEVRLCAGMDDKHVSYSIPVDTYDTGLPALELADGNIKLAPFSMRIYDQRLDIDIVHGINELRLIYTDGSEYAIADDANNVDETYYGLSGRDVDEPCVHFVFNRVVDVYDVAAVVINGVEYKVE